MGGSDGIRVESRSEPSTGSTPFREVGGDDGLGDGLGRVARRREGNEESPGVGINEFAETGECGIGQGHQTGGHALHQGHTEALVVAAGRDEAAPCDDVGKVGVGDESVREDSSGQGATPTDPVDHLVRVGAHQVTHQVKRAHRRQILEQVEKSIDTLVGGVAPQVQDACTTARGPHAAEAMMIDGDGDSQQLLGGHQPLESSLVGHRDGDDALDMGEEPGHHDTEVELLQSPQRARVEVATVGSQQNGHAGERSADPGDRIQEELGVVDVQHVGTTECAQHSGCEEVGTDAPVGHPANGDAVEDLVVGQDLAGPLVGPVEGQNRSSDAMVRQVAAEPFDEPLHATDGGPVLTGEVEDLGRGPGTAGRRIHVLLVSSSGGVLLDLLALRPWWSRHRVSWATVKAVDTLSLLADMDVHWVRERTARAPWGVVPGVLEALRTLRAADPDLVVSSGSGVSIGFFIAARLLRVPCFWFETLNLVGSTGLSGRICARLAQEVLVQRPSMLDQHPGAVVIGELY